MKRFLLSIYAVHQRGVCHESGYAGGLVETSSNLGIGQDARRQDCRSDQSGAVPSFLHARICRRWSVPALGTGWSGHYYHRRRLSGMEAESVVCNIWSVAVESYKRLFGVEPKVKAMRAGSGMWICSWRRYPSVDMVSFGPTLRGVHSCPDERMLIPTVDKFWRHLLDVLVYIPVKA